MESSNVNRSNVTQFPIQTIPDSQKKDKWFQECIDAAENLFSFDNNGVRSSYYNKRINQNLRNNILVQRDVEKYLNPAGIKVSTTPERMQHQGLANSKIMLLKGEESKRLQKHDFMAFISSGDEQGITSKTEDLKNMWLQSVNEIIASDEDLSEEEIEAKLAKVNQYQRYSYKDIRELIANKILRYEYERLEMAYKLADTWENLLVFGEEVMAIEEYGNDVYARVVNPLNLYCLMSPDSKFIEDSDVIVEYAYMTLRSAVDLYYDELTLQDIKDLENEFKTNNSGRIQPGFNRNISIEERFGIEMQDSGNFSLLSTPGYFSGAFDMRGNIRVLRVCWRSSRKIGRLKSYDEYGVPIYSIVHSDYKVDKSLGEEVEWMIVNEWMEGHKLGLDKYVRKRVIPYQGRSEYNLSVCSPPYTGVINTFNQSTVMSLFDYMKPLDYLYDIVFYRYLLALSKYKGPITVINKSMIPSEIDPLTYLNFVDSTNLMLLDPTNEIMKGPNQGKSAGMYNTLTATSINSQMGDYVRQHVEMLSFIESQLDKISGINNARQGVLDGKENVGTSNMAWTASNSMTEPYYRLHNLFKKRVLQRLLNVSLYVWSKNPKKAQYVLDDFTSEIVTVFEDLKDVEMDVHIGNTSELQEIRELLRSLSQAAMQNGTITLSQVGNMYLKDSTAAMLKYLEQKEEEFAQRQSEAQEAEMQARAEEQQLLMEIEAAKLELEYEKLEREDINKQLDRELAIEKEIIDAMGYAQETDINNNQVPDVIEQGKLALDNLKTSQEIVDKQLQRNQEKELKTRELNLKEQESENKLKIENLRMKQKEKEAKMKMKMEELKAKVALQVARTNKNKYDK